MISSQEYAAAVDPAREADPNGLTFRNALQPTGNLAGSSTNVCFADNIQVRRQRVGFGCEEARVDRIRVRTPDQLQLHNMVRRNHTRVARMKLAIEPFALQPVIDCVDAMRDYQGRTFLPLGKEVAHGPIQ